MLKISLYIFIITALFCAAILLRYEREHSDNIIVNIIKRAVAESGALISRHLLRNDDVSIVVYAPAKKAAANLDLKDLSIYVKEDMGAERANFAAVKNYEVSDYAKYFQYEDLSNSKLKLLRERYGLDSLVTAGATELDKLVLLNNWVHQKISRGRPKNVNYNFNTLNILTRVESEKFFCSEYSTVLVQCGLSVGYSRATLWLKYGATNSQNGSSWIHTIIYIMRKTVSL